MTYIALLRGINVGGKNQISMAELKDLFLSIGCLNVKTYINSGNVIFSDSRHKDTTAELIGNAINDKFGLNIKTLVIDKPTLDNIVSVIPSTWQNDKVMKCDVFFLWSSINNPAIVNQLPINPSVDNVIYTDGAIIWSVIRNQINKSGLVKNVDSKLYKETTIRNCNTVRKLSELADQKL